MEEAVVTGKSTRLAFSDTDLAKKFKIRTISRGLD